MPLCTHAEKNKNRSLCPRPGSSVWSGGRPINNNKFAQNNFGRGPFRGAVAHIRRKIPIGSNGAPQIRPKSTPSRGPISKSQHLPHPWTRPTYDAKRHPHPIRCFSTMDWTDRPTDRPTHVCTDRPTDRPRESLTIIGRCATRATRPNNNNYYYKFRPKTVRRCDVG